MTNSTKNEGGMSRTASEAFADFVLRHRLIIIVIIAVLTVVFGYQGLNQQLSAGFEKSIPLSHPYMETYQNYRDELGGANRVTIFVEDIDPNEDIFNEHFFDVLEQVTADMLGMTGVDPRTVTSLFTPNVNYVAVNEEGFTGSRIVPSDFSSSPEDLDEVRNNLFQSAEIGRSVAVDLSGALVTADLIERDPRTGEQIDYRDLAKELETLRNRYESDRIAIRMIGFAPFTGDLIDGAQSVILFFGITLVLTAILLVFFVRSLKLAVAVLVTVLISVAWQLGGVRLMGFAVDPMSILVPFLVLAIGVSHAVQMTYVWRTAMADNGGNSVEAARRALAQLVIPGSIALLSDTVGFAVVMLIDIEIIRELGIIASFGVGVMLILNLAMLPIILSVIRLNTRELDKAKNDVQGSDHPIWGWLAQNASRRRGLVIVGLCALPAAYTFMIHDQRVIGETEAGSPEFWPDARYNVDARIINEKFRVGLDEFTIMAESERSICVDYPQMKRIDEFVWEMENLAPVTSIVALTEVVRERNIGNFEAYPLFLGLPANEQMIAANLRGIEDSQNLWANDCYGVPITLYLSDHKAGTLQTVVDAVKAFNAKHPDSEVTFRLAMGNAGVMAATNEAVSAAQLKIAAAIFLAVGVFCLLTFRSWRLTLCALIPLGLVAYFANAVMVHLGIGLKVATLPVLALGVGVGVDYSIYMIARLRIHLEQGVSLVKAYNHTLKEVGLAVIFTACTMSIGVGMWWWSDLKFQSDMGVLLAYMFFVNMLGAIFLMPALAALLIKDRSKAKPGDDEKPAKAGFK